MRVLHCPTATGGHPGALAAAERELGLDSRSVALRSPFAHSVDRILYRSSDGALRHQARRWDLALRALRSFDLVHFNFGSTCLPHAVPLAVGAGPREHLFHAYSRLVEQLDMRLLRAAGVPVVVTVQGSDARQTDFCERHLDAGERDGLEPYIGRERDRDKRRRVRGFARCAGHMFFLNPDLAEVLPRDRASFLPYAVSLPDPVPPRPISSRMVVAHAPTNQAVKGTRYLIEAVQAVGDRVELDLISGASREETLTRMARADLVVDQLILGWYGATAVEAMAIGRPVVAAILDDYLQCVPAELLRDVPSVRSTRHDLTETLRQCLYNRSELQARAEAGPDFARSWHMPTRIAEQTRVVYQTLFDQPRPR